MRLLLLLLALLAATALHAAAATPTIRAFGEGYECNAYGQCRLYLPYYAPLVLIVPAGATVAFLNADGSPGTARLHSVTASLGGFNTGLVEPGTSVTFTAPAAPGDHPYHCIRHPVQMHAVLRVT